MREGFFKGKAGVCAALVFFGAILLCLGFSITANEPSQAAGQLTQPEINKTSPEGYSPLFAASLQDTLQELDAKEKGVYDVNSGAVTENNDGSMRVAFSPGIPNIPKPVVPSIPTTPTVPSVPSTPVPTYTSSYSCGTTCGSTCVGSSTCAGSSTCFGTSTCAGASTCVGTNTCVGSTSCNSATCVGTTTCTGSNTCNASTTCSIGPGAVCSNLPVKPSTPSNKPVSETPASQSSTTPEPQGQVNTAATPSEWAASYVTTATSLGLIPLALQNNYTANITRGEFCSVLTQVLSRKNYAAYSSFTAPAVSPFTDTSDKDIIWLNGQGIVSGIGEGLFNPNGQITRQEAAVMLKRAGVAFGLDDVGIDVAFADQPEVADWAADALGFVVDKGIMNGTGDNRFTPLGMYTREQSYVTLIRLYDVLP